MKFVQLIEFTSGRADEIEALDRTWRETAGDTSTTARSVVVRDRDDDRHYFVVVEFPSYEEAMRNNERPETKKFAAGFAELCDDEPRYLNTDLVMES